VSVSFLGEKILGEPLSSDEASSEERGWTELNRRLKGQNLASIPLDYNPVGLFLPKETQTMSQFMLRAHGGGDVAREQRGGAVATGMLVHDTQVGVRRPVHMRELEYLVSNTTGVPMESPVLDGVLTSTVQAVPFAQRGASSAVMASHEKFATAPKMAVYGQVPYAEGKDQMKAGSAPKAGTKKGEERKTARKAYEKKPKA